MDNERNRSDLINRNYCTAIWLPGRVLHRPHFSLSVDCGVFEPFVTHSPTFHISVLEVSSRIFHMDIAWSLRHRHTTGTHNPHTDNPGTNASVINNPVSFVSGQFAGRTIRFELQELQKAESGRKKVFRPLLYTSSKGPDWFAHRYAKVDRRPLDPPPAVLLRVIEVRDAESGQWEGELASE